MKVWDLLFTSHPGFDIPAPCRRRIAVTRRHDFPVETDTRRLKHGESL